jgi:HEPN domain-containing protein
MLKAFLVYANLKPPRVHDLEELRGLCENIDGSFSQLMSASIHLNDYSSQPRYPFGLEITEDDMRLALEDCEMIIKFVREKLRMNGF